MNRTEPADLISRRTFVGRAAGAGAVLGTGLLRPDVLVARDDEDDDQHRLVIARQGSFMVGGTVIQNPGDFDPNHPTAAGQTLHGNHAYVQFQIPPNARELPLVMWHGSNQSGKTWEATPDGREGYQTIFLRRGFAVYILDQPGRGRAGRRTAAVTVTPTPDEQGNFQMFRLGIWPNFFPGVQFPNTPDALDQFVRQETPNTGPDYMFRDNIVIDAAAALFERIGPAVLLTHSAGGRWGWFAAIRSANVQAIVSYETGAFVFPEAEVPPPIVTPTGTTAGFGVSLADFERLTRIPIQLVYGDNIPTETSPNPGLDLHYRSFAMAALFVDAVNRHGGDASILHLPDVGVFGNTHFAFADLNNLQVADLLSDYLHQKRLDTRGRR
jgi:hypothetical protein